MVKNGFGGNKAKKNSSKSFNVFESNVRYSQCSDEKYAVVETLLGNNMCQVFCIDGKQRQCVIRGKFSGRGKRTNRINKGTWVLVGLRSWEVSSKNKCDLLEVYSDNDKQKIIKNENYDFNGFLKYNEYNECNDSEDLVNFSSNIDITDFDDEDHKSIKSNIDNYVDIIFSSDEEEEVNELQTDKSNLDTKDYLKKVIDKFGEINIDDI